MSIKPQNFEVSESILRQRLKLSSNVKIFPFGYEGLADKELINFLQQRYNASSLFFRTRPDFMVIDGDNIYLVEAKQRTTNVEAVQLFFNKQLEKMGIKVVYSFPDVTICASLIPLEKVIVPENYKKEFNENLKYLFESEGVTNFLPTKHVTNGSGDAFVPVKLDDLRILSDEEGV